MAQIDDEKMLRAAEASKLLLQLQSAVALMTEAVKWIAENGDLEVSNLKSMRLGMAKYEGFDSALRISLRDAQAAALLNTLQPRASGGKTKPASTHVADELDMPLNVVDVGKRTAKKPSLPASKDSANTRKKQG